MQWGASTVLIFTEAVTHQHALWTWLIFEYVRPSRRMRRPFYEKQSFDVSWCTSSPDSCLRRLWGESNVSQKVNRADKWLTSKWIMVIRRAFLWFSFIHPVPIALRKQTAEAQKQCAIYHLTHVNQRAFKCRNPSVRTEHLFKPSL